MTLRGIFTTDRWGSWLLAGLFLIGGGVGQTASAQSTIIPGSGYRVTDYGDDFEDEKWQFNFNSPKASREQDKDNRFPLGTSINNRVYESGLRGQPDIIKRVPTPPGGLKWSKGALLLQTKDSGIPNYPSGQMRQDDTIINPYSQMGGSVNVSQGPSMVVRVWMPEFKDWERRTGSHFGIRGDVEGMIWKDKEDDDDGHRRPRFFKRGPRRVRDSYWPGYFLEFHQASKPGEKDRAYVICRCDERGQEFMGPEITKTGWWTFGMSWTPDGNTSYFAKPGVDPLTAKDHIRTCRPYNADPLKVSTWFFNSINIDDGRTWSTAFVVDDPQLFYTGSR